MGEIPWESNEITNKNRKYFISVMDFKYYYLYIERAVFVYKINKHNERNVRE